MHANTRILQVAHLFVPHGEVALPFGVLRVLGGEPFGDREAGLICVERPREFALGFEDSPTLS